MPYEYLSYEIGYEKDYIICNHFSIYSHVFIQFISRHIYELNFKYLILDPELNKANGYGQAITAELEAKKD
jgi:hypothetical protein